LTGILSPSGRLLLLNCPRSFQKLGKASGYFFLQETYALCLGSRWASWSLAVPPSMLAQTPTLEQMKLQLGLNPLRYQQAQAAVERGAMESAKQLPTIAPKRFNPAGKAWLSILHTQRGDFQFTVLFSNTARAHELGRTRDWVVISYYDDHHREGQATVVTETRCPLAGKRVALVVRYNAESIIPRVDRRLCLSRQGRSPWLELFR
jgi:hypothetical protein